MPTQPNNTQPSQNQQILATLLAEFSRQGATMQEMAEILRGRIEGKDAPFDESREYQRRWDGLNYQIQQLIRQAVANGDSEQSIRDCLNDLQDAVRESVSREGKMARLTESSRVQSPSFDNALAVLRGKITPDTTAPTIDQETAQRWDGLSSDVQKLVKIGIDQGKSEGEIKSILDALKADLKSNLTQEREKKVDAMMDQASNPTGRFKSGLTEKGADFKKLGTDLKKEGTALGGDKGAKAAEMGGKMEAVGGKMMKFGKVLDKVTAIVALAGKAFEIAADLTKFEEAEERLHYEKQKEKDMLEVEQKYETAAYNQKLRMREMQTNAEIAKQAKAIEGQNYVKAKQVGLGSLMGGTDDAAYQAAQAAIEAGTSQMLLASRAQTAYAKQAQENLADTTQYEQSMNVLDKKLEQTAKTLEIEQGRIDFDRRQYLIQQATDPANIAMVGGAAAAFGGPVTAAVAATAEVVALCLQPLIAGIQKQQKAADDLERLKKTQEADRAVYQAENAKKLTDQWAQNEREYQVARLENEQALFELRLEYAKEIAKTYLELAKKTMDATAQFDNMASDVAFSMGMTSRKQMDAYERAMLRAGAGLAAKWGKSTEDMLNVQKVYSNTSGRASFLSQKDYDATFALSKYTGSDAEAAQLIGSMEVFRHSASGSVRLVDKAFDMARKKGLDLNKLSKDIAQNIKLAQKYDFKGGLRNMTEMVAKAQAIRFDINSMDGILSKIREGDLASNIDMSARLQVLGGGFARGSNMFNMLYEAFADPTSLMERYNSMLDGMGTFNEDTGEVEFGQGANILMNEFAKITGQNFVDVKNQARAKVQGDRIDEYLSQAGVNYSPEMVELIKQQATRTDDGSWVITDALGRTKDISQMEESDLVQLLPHEQAIENYVASIVTDGVKLKGGDLAQQMITMHDTMVEYHEMQKQKLQTSWDNFTRTHDEVTRGIASNYRLMAAAYEGYCAKSQQGNSELDTAQQSIVTKAKNIATTLGDVSETLKTALDKMRADMGVDKPESPTESEAENSAEPGSIRWGLGFAQTAIAAGYVHSARDGLIQGTGHPLLMPASDVTPINDGLVVTSPKDQYLAAQSNGPLDKMVDHLIWVDKAYDNMRQGVSIAPASALGSVATAFASKPVQSPSPSQQSQAGTARDAAPSTQTVRLEINGKLELSSNGQQIDIINELRNNPVMVNALMQLIAQRADQFSTGGRTSLESSSSTFCT